jgi:hypothetical protein
MLIIRAQCRCSIDVNSDTDSSNISSVLCGIASLKGGGLDRLLGPMPLLFAASGLSDKGRIHCSGHIDVYTPLAGQHLASLLIFAKILYESTGIY